MENNFISRTFFGSYFGMTLFFAFIVGVTSCNICHFAIEDYFNQNVVRNSWFGIWFGIEYAINQATLVVSSVFLMFLILIKNKMNHENFQLNPKQKKKLMTLLIIIGISVFGNSVVIIYGYFSGSSDLVSLLNILVTLAFLAIATLFIYNRLEENETFLRRHSCWIEPLILIKLVFISTYFTLSFAPPSLMRNFQKDLTTFNQLIKIKNSIGAFYIKNKKLPEVIDVLKEKGYFSSIDITPYTYEKKDNTTFNICGTFLSNSADFKKRNRSKLNFTREVFFKKGHFCITDQIKK